MPDRSQQEAASAPRPAPGASQVPLTPAPPPTAEVEQLLSADPNEPPDGEACVRDPEYPLREDADADWLADLRGEDVAAPWTGDGEAHAAGFLHRTGGRGGFGFAAGGALDLMEPGPVLAGFLADAVAGGVPGGAVLVGPDGFKRPLIGQGGAGEGMAALGESELIGVLCAARRMASLAAAQELEAVITLARRRNVQAAEREDLHLAEHVVDELAAALCLTGRAAGRLLEIAGSLARLPAVRAALTLGLIDRDRAVVIGDELAALADQDARTAAGKVLDRAPGLTTGQLRDALRKIVLSIDPDAVRRRREKARTDASVQLWDEPSGNTALAGRELPRAQAIAADARLTAYAKWLQARGAAGTLDQLRAAVYIAMLSGQPIETLLPAPPGAASSGPARPGGCDRSPAAPGGGRGPAGSDGRSCAPAGPDAPGGDTSQTGSADPARGGRAPGDAGPCGSAGAPASGRDSNGGGAPPGGLPSAPDWPGGGSWRPAVTGSINLTVPLSAWLGQSDAPGEVGGHGAADADTCRDIAAWLAASDRARWCVTFTDADGRAVAHACARHGPPPPPP
jgi:hypothetical protein